MLCERLDGRTRILLKKQGVYDIMSVSEPEACLHGYGERRMSIMIAAKAASSTEGANHDIIKQNHLLASVILRNALSELCSRYNERKRANMLA